MSAVQRLHPGPRLSEASVHGGTIYLEDVGKQYQQGREVST